MFDILAYSIFTGRKETAKREKRQQEEDDRRRAIHAKQTEADKNGASQRRQRRRGWEGRTEVFQKASKAKRCKFGAQAYLEAGNGAVPVLCSLVSLGALFLCGGRGTRETGVREGYCH